MRKCYLLLLVSFFISLPFILFPILLSASEIDSSVDQLSSGEREGSFQQIIDCQTDADCNDQDPCTNEICYRVTPEEEAGQCLATGRIENCPQIPSNEPTPPAFEEVPETPKEESSTQECIEEKTESTPPPLVTEETPSPAVNTAPRVDTMFGGGCVFTPSVSLSSSRFSQWIGIGIFLGILWIKRNKIHHH